MSALPDKDWPRVLKYLAKYAKDLGAATEEDAEDLAARAAEEYLMALSRGDDIRSPVGWMRLSLARRQSNAIRGIQRGRTKISRYKSDPTSQSPREYDPMTDGAWELSPELLLVLDQIAEHAEGMRAAANAIDLALRHWGSDKEDEPWVSRHRRVKSAAEYIIWLLDQGF